MNKLLAGNLSRLRKNILFWLALVCAIVTPIYVIINNWYYKKLWDLPLYAEGPFLSIGSDYFFMIALAVVISLFIGTEYGYHTIRNKLITGYSRLSVYLANLTVSIIIAVAMYLTGAISACVGIPLLGGFVLPFGKRMIQMGVAVVSISVMATIICTISIIIGNRVIGVMVSLLAAIGLQYLPFALWSDIQFLTDMGKLIVFGQSWICCCTIYCPPVSCINSQLHWKIYRRISICFPCTRFFSWRCSEQLVSSALERRI